MDKISKGEIMKYYLWHNTKEKANQYFICKGTKVLFQIPNFIALIISKGENNDKTRSDRCNL